MLQPGLGGVIGNDEERSEEIHCGVQYVVCGLRIEMI